MSGYRRAATALGCARFSLQPGARGAGTGARKARLRSSPRRRPRPCPRVVARCGAGVLRDHARGRPRVAFGWERGLRLQRNQRVGELRRGDGSRCLAGGPGRFVDPHRARLPGRSSAWPNGATGPASTTPKSCPLHPFAAWHALPGGHFWASIGAGAGSLSHRDDLGFRSWSRSDVRLFAYAVGASVPVAGVLSGELQAEAGIEYFELDIEGGGRISASLPTLKGRDWRAGPGVERAHSPARLPSPWPIGG